MKTYNVYTRTRGNFVVEAYSRRHAVCVVVARLGLSESETKEVSGWAVSERSLDCVMANPEMSVYVTPAVIGNVAKEGAK